MKCVDLYGLEYKKRADLNDPPVVTVNISKQNPLDN